MSRILACHDGSEAANRALATHCQEFHEFLEVTLFHVLEAFPPELLEHPGETDPFLDARREAVMVGHRDQWVHRSTLEFERAVAPLVKRLGQMPGRCTVRVKVVPSWVDGDFEAFLEEEALEGAYDEVVLVHHPSSRLKKWFHLTKTERVPRRMPRIHVIVLSTAGEQEGAAPWSEELWGP